MLVLTPAQCGSVELGSICDLRRLTDRDVGQIRWSMTSRASRPSSHLPLSSRPRTNPFPFWMPVHVDYRVATSNQGEAREHRFHLNLPNLSRPTRACRPWTMTRDRRISAIGSPAGGSRTGDGSEVSTLRQALPQGSPEFLHRGFRPLEVTYDYDADGRDDEPPGDRLAARTRCGVTASSCRSTASRRSASTSAARR